MRKMTYLKSNVHRWAFIVMIGILLSFAACSKNDDTVSKHPFLKIENLHDEDYVTITGIRLVNYEFFSLNINSGDSQTFSLDRGMPGGTEDIYVIIYYSKGAARTISSEVNF